MNRFNVVHLAADGTAMSVSKGVCTAESQALNVIQPRRLRNDWLLIALVFLAMVPILVVRFPPLYDYPHWVYQAHVVTHYSRYVAWYQLKLMPLPNLGSTIPLLFLTPIIGAEASAKILLAVYACATVLSWAYLVRGIARAPTAIELLGPVLAYNTFFFNGFLGYVVSVPVLLTALGLLVRKSGGQLTRWDVILMGLVSTAAYLGHLFAWIPIAVFLAVAVFITRTHEAKVLWSQLAPSTLLVMYVAGRVDEGAVSSELYRSLLNKLYSLAGPLLAFQRIDPFPSPVPVLVLNLATLAAICALIWYEAYRHSISTRARPVLYTSAVLLAVAAVLPFSWVAAMGAADQRLAFAAYAGFLAGLAKPGQARSRYLAALIALGVLGMHTVGFLSADQDLRTVYRAIQARPSHASVFVAALRHPPLYGDCQPKRLLDAGSGVFPLQWFPVYDAVERGGVVAATFNTAALQGREDIAYSMSFGQFQTRQERDKLIDDVVELGKRYDYLFLFGCPEDIRSVEEIWCNGGDLVDRGSYYAIVELKGHDIQ